MATRTHTHTTHTHSDAFMNYGTGTSLAVGMLHGVGAETPTQVLIFLTAAGAGGVRAGVVVLGVFLLRALHGEHRASARVGVRIPRRVATLQRLRDGFGRYGRRKLGAGVRLRSR